MKQLSLTAIGNSATIAHDYTGNCTKFGETVKFQSGQLKFNEAITNSSRCVVALASEASKGESVPVDCDVPFGSGSVICKRERADTIDPNTILKRNSKEE